MMDKMMNRETVPNFDHVDDTYISQIYHQLNRLYDVLETQQSSIEKEKSKVQSFVSDISHQLKTPLTNLHLLQEAKIYGVGENRVVALDKVNLEIDINDFISIMGPSGSGKSTLLHLLSGLDRPTSGSLTYDGRDIYSFNDKELSAFRRKSIGFIFQHFNLLPVLTAKENIIMPLLLDKKQPDEAYLMQLTELLGISDRLEHLPHELSGGQQQRVAIARALIAKPGIIFADEPTGNLDSKSGGEVMKMLENIWEKTGTRLVIITHDRRVAQMADRQFVIVDGVLSEVTVK